MDVPGGLVVWASGPGLEGQNLSPGAPSQALAVSFQQAGARRSHPHPTPRWSTSCPFSVLPGSREQEGTESTSEEGQLPQVVEELKDLQVAPGTRLAKFQLKVKGEEERQMARSTIWTVEAGRVLVARGL